jgi:hypothetical protein
MRLPQVWRVRAHNYRLEGGVCKRCGSRALPSRVVCPECQAGPVVRIPVEIVPSLPLFERRIPVPVLVRVELPGRR